MKKQISLPYFLLVLCGILLGVVLAPMPVGAQQETSKTIMERVEVTNVEVPVRVLLKGQPVLNLNIEDFTLYENNKKVQINGFFLDRKTLTPASSAASGSEARTFVLAFNISDYNQDVENGVNHLFEKILVPQDRVFLFVNKNVQEYANLKDMAQVKTQILATLQMEGRKAGQRMMEYFLRTETFVGLKNLTKDPSDIIEFLKRYVSAWREYQDQYVKPKTDLFYYFAQYLEPIKGPKWVLNFEQFQFFPRFRPSNDSLNVIREMATKMINSEFDTAVSQGRMLGNLLSQINSDLELGKDFPAETIGKLFYKMNATFYNFYIKSTDLTVLQSAEYRKIASDLETLFDRITVYSGGQTLAANDLVKALDTVATEEDAYYRLTYVPGIPQRKGTIKVTLREKKYKVLYDDNAVSDYNPPRLTMGASINEPAPEGIKVEDFSFGNGTLAFTLRQFLIGSVEGNQVGRMQVRIRVMDKDNKSVFDATKVLTTPKTEMTVSIPAFKNLAKGQHTFLIDVVDVLNNSQDNFVQGVEVN